MSGIAGHGAWQRKPLPHTPGRSTVLLDEADGLESNLRARPETRCGGETVLGRLGIPWVGQRDVRRRPPRGGRQQHHLPQGLEVLLPSGARQEDAVRAERGRRPKSEGEWPRCWRREPTANRLQTQSLQFVFSAQGDMRRDQVELDWVQSSSNLFDSLGNRTGGEDRELRSGVQDGRSATARVVRWLTLALTKRIQHGA